MLEIFALRHGKVLQPSLWESRDVDEHVTGRPKQAYGLR